MYPRQKDLRESYSLEASRFDVLNPAQTFGFEMP